MKLKEFHQQLKKAKVVQEKYSYIIDKPFYLTTEGDNLINQQKDGNNIPINISSNGFIVITPYAKGLYSDKFLNEIAKTYIKIIKLDFWGNPIWGFYPAARTLANLTKAQLMLTTEKHNILRKDFIEDLINSKINSEGLVLNRAKIPKLKKDIQIWIDSMMLIEGEYASKYWGKYLENFNRATEKDNKKNYKAQDHINALLNLGYGILAHKITFTLYKNGLDPTIGFYHYFVARGQRYSLTWDLIEPYRYIIDNIILKYYDEIDTDDFEYTVEDKVRYLVLREIQHKAGQKQYKLKYEHNNPYKKWVDIFTKELYKVPVDFWVAKYKEVLFKVMTKDGLITKEGKASDEAVRASGINQATKTIKQLSQKMKKAKIPKEQPEDITDNEIIQGDLEKEAIEPEQVKDITLRKILTKK